MFLLYAQISLPGCRCEKDSTHPFSHFFTPCLYSIRLNTRSIKQTTGIQNLDAAAYLGELVAFPALAEQTTIARYLDDATANIDAAITRTRRQIELLREYRTRLIADVVTGKLDVREAAARLPEVSEPVENGTQLA